MGDEYVPDYVDKKALVERYEREHDMGTLLSLDHTINMLQLTAYLKKIDYNQRYTCMNLLFTDYADRLVEQKR